MTEGSIKKIFNDELLEIHNRDQRFLQRKNRFPNSLNNATCLLIPILSLTAMPRPRARNTKTARLG